MRQSILLLIAVAVIGLAVAASDHATAEVRRNTSQQPFTSGAMRSELVLREIAATLKSIEARLARLETIALNAAQDHQSPRHAP